VRDLISTLRKHEREMMLSRPAGLSAHRHCFVNYDNSGPMCDELVLDFSLPTQPSASRLGPVQFPEYRNFVADFCRSPMGRSGHQ
jgi:hypothetical protein